MLNEGNFIITVPAYAWHAYICICAYVCIYVSLSICTYICIDIYMCISRERDIDTNIMSKLLQIIFRIYRNCWRMELLHDMCICCFHIFNFCCCFQQALSTRNFTGRAIVFCLQALFQLL